MYSGAYYLVNEINPLWTIFVKTVSNGTKNEKHFVAQQEGYIKDVKKCFGILQAH